MYGSPASIRSRIGLGSSRSPRPSMPKVYQGAAAPRSAGVVIALTRRNRHGSHAVSPADASDHPGQDPGRDLGRNPLMAQLDTQVLPLLPLTTGVVLPGMVITLTVESDDARRAVTAADATRGEILLVPKVGQRFAQVGTVAKVEDVGRLQNGMEALVIRGLHRAVISRGVPGTGDAVWVEVDARPDEF